MFQTLLPNVGPGALKSREDPNEKSGKVSLVSVLFCEAYNLRAKSTLGLAFLDMPQYMHFV